MNEYLIQHALEHVWCNPEQDRQLIYKLARLTPKYGVRLSVNLFYERLRLPDPQAHYHLYQLGQVIPQRLGLPLKPRQWMSLAELANQHLLHTDLYLSNGIQFPRFDTHVWLTPGRNLIVAVKINDRVGSLEGQDLFLRFYSNAFFQSPRSEGKRFLEVKGTVLKTEDELLRFQRALNDRLEATGAQALCYVNGRHTHHITLATATVGDVVEYVLDPSIKKVVDFNIQDLRYFHSTLDQTTKYILHYDDPSVTTIEYLDDQDLYLINPGPGERFMGVYYHHNEPQWLRMLTHKDYALPVERLQEFLAVHPDDPRHEIQPDRWPADRWERLSDLRLRLYLRHSGYHRPLVADAHRIQELYKLSSPEILAALTGEEGGPALWRAENLEQAPYVRFMSAPPSRVYPPSEYHRTGGDAPPEERDRRRNEVGEIYGYHAVAHLLNRTPSPVYTKDGMRYADLAYEHRTNATVFEYDTQGNLLGYHPHQTGAHYLVRHPDTARVEALSGLGGPSTRTQYGADPVTLTPRYNHRVYVRRRWGGTLLGDWRDITEAPDRAEFGYLDDTQVPHRWVWTYDPMAWYGAVRQDQYFLCREYSLTRQGGLLSFQLTSQETHAGVTEDLPMEIPTSELDIFLNQRLLIEGLDYQVDWPNVVIRNLEYLVPGDHQAVVVRAHGFCNSDLSRPPLTEVGFVRHGHLSQDHEYDLHTHRLQRVVVDGQLLDPEVLVFDEDRNDLTIPNVRNGAPYVIQTPPTVLRDAFTDDYAARARDDEREQAVREYLTLKLPPHPRPPMDLIETPYRVVSVFANKLLHDLKEGILAPAGMTGHYGETELRKWCQHYEWLLPYDLANQDYDQVHVAIWPHWHPDPVELNLYQYNLYVRALDLYLRHRLDLAPFIKVVRMT